MVCHCPKCKFGTPLENYYDTIDYVKYMNKHLIDLSINNILLSTTLCQSGEYLLIALLVKLMASNSYNDIIYEYNNETINRYVDIILTITKEIIKNINNMQLYDVYFIGYFQ